MAQGTEREAVTLTVPRPVLEAAGIAPGDQGRFEVIGPETIRVTISRGSAADLPSAPLGLERSDVEAGDHNSRAEPHQVRYADLPTLSLAEWLERYRIEGPVDIEADREAWYDEAAKDIMGE